MGTSAPEACAPFPRKRSIAAVLLLLHLCTPGAWGTDAGDRHGGQRGMPCQILRCNADFVAATLDLGGVGGGLREAVKNSGYCSALRSYGMCTKRTARACRGDLAYHSAVQGMAAAYPCHTQLTPLYDNLALQGIEDLLLQHRCPRAGPTAQPRPPPQAPMSGEACLYEKGYFLREGRAPEYLHCGVFGDPHVRTFADEFQTCAARGAWPLVDNQYLYIQATNTPTGRGAHTTTLTKITIIFKSWRQCAEQQIYQAELDDVPAAFADGSVSSGGGVGGGGSHPPSLAVRSQSPGRHAEIRAAHIGAVLVVRQSGRSLGLSVRAPRAVVEAFGPERDVQLCVWGCPASQRIDVLSPPPASFSSSASSSASAQAHCGALLPARDMYYQACVFDLLVSGDLNSSLAAVAALEDARGMIDDGDRLHLLPPPPVAASGHWQCRSATTAMGLMMAALLGAAWSFAT